MWDISNIYLGGIVSEKEDPGQDLDHSLEVDGLYDWSVGLDKENAQDRLWERQMVRRTVSWESSTTK